MGISSYIPSITVADPGMGHNPTFCTEVVNGKEGGERKRRRRERKGGEGKGKREEGMIGETGHPRFSDGLTPLDRNIPIIYQDGYQSINLYLLKFAIK